MDTTDVQNKDSAKTETDTQELDSEETSKIDEIHQQALELSVKSLSALIKKIDELIKEKDTPIGFLQAEIRLTQLKISKLQEESDDENLDRPSLIKKLAEYRELSNLLLTKQNELFKETSKQPNKSKSSSGVKDKYLINGQTFEYGGKGTRPAGMDEALKAAGYDPSEDSDPEKKEARQKFMGRCKVS